jgi:CheY-like chemotaxis protein
MASILVIDDEHVQGVLRGILEEAGYMVVVGNNGQQGLQQFRREPADLVLLDIFSCDVGGWMIALREAAQLAEQLIAETMAKYCRGQALFRLLLAAWAITWYRFTNGL